MASASTRRLLLLRPMSHNRLSAHLLRRSIHLRQPTPLRLLHLHCIRLAADASTAPTDSSASALSSASSPSLPPPVSASSPSASVRRQPRPPSSSSSSSSSYSSTDVLGIAFFLGLSAFTLYLGSWQLHRKQWKEKLVVERTEALKGTAVDLTSLLQQQSATNCGNDWHAVPEFQRVSVSGVFEYSGQMKVGLRSAPVTKTGLSGQGYFVITPMSVDGQTVLVNRGWIDRKHAAHIPEETATQHDAVTHHPEKTPAFLGSYDPEKAGSYISLDAAHMSQRLHLPTQSPVLVDLISPSPSPLLHRRPIDAYLQFATTPLVHTVYAITWFALAAAGVAGTYIRFRRGGRGGLGEPVRRMRQAERRS